MAGFGAKAGGRNERHDCGQSTLLGILGSNSSGY